MKKIKFNQPKFIIPLLILPFLFLGFYFFSAFTDKEEKVSDLETVDGINANIPDATVEKNSKSKLQEFQEALNKQRRNTAIDDIGKEEDQKMLIEEDTTANSSRVLRDQGSAARAKLRELAQQRINNAEQRANNRATATQRSSSSRNSSRPQTNKKTDEMEDFKKQMKFIDSMTNPEKYNRKKALVEKRRLDSIANAQRKEETLKISKTSSQEQNYFNTIKANKNETFISAILDEGIKVYRESRVRVRVMDDVFIGDKLIPKGHYLYGVVTNFKAQRVVIHISSIIINDQIIPVDISLYDNDGMEGIYVPNTMFRQFAQELGVQTASDANSITVEGEDSRSNPLFESISTAVQTSSKAIRKALRSNKVRVKYSHKVYLVNNEN